MDAEGNILQTKTNNVHGQIIFDEMTYEEVGEYSYTIREVPGVQNGVTYDDHEFDVMVNVEDDGEGQLIATLVYLDGAVEFTNDYTPAVGNVVLEAEKILEGQELREGQFHYELVDESENIIDKAENDANGQIIFDEISYDATGRYTYIIREVQGTQGGITYDTNTHTVDVDVVDEEGQLYATPNYRNGPAVFINHYETAPDSIVLEAEKVLEGQNLRNHQFSFELLDEAGEVLQTKPNNVDGQVFFDEITYEEVGEFIYTLREVVGTQGGVTYDTTEYQAVVTVTDNGEGQLEADVEYSKDPHFYK